MAAKNVTAKSAVERLSDAQSRLRDLRGEQHRLGLLQDDQQKKLASTNDRLSLLEKQIEDAIDSVDELTDLAEQEAAAGGTTTFPTKPKSNTTVASASVSTSTSK